MASSPPASNQADTPQAGAHAHHPLLKQTAQAIADALNRLHCELDDSSAALAETRGSLDMVLDTTGPHPTTYTLQVVPDHPGDTYPVHVEIKRQQNKRAVSGDTAPCPSYQSTRRGSDAEPEKDLVSRKRRRLEDGDEAYRQRSVDNEDIMPLNMKEGMEDILAKLRDDVQEDTSECVNHVQRLLRRFRDEWHEKNTWEFEHASSFSARAAPRSSVNDGIPRIGPACPSPNAERDDPEATVSDLVKRESILLSSQIRWVEECRRVAADAHDKREENWRTSSAGFHERNRQDRETFQARMIHESSLHSQTLQQLLNEVKAIGLYAQSMKWETPSSLSAGPVYPHVQVPVAPAFPTQAPPTPASSRGPTSNATSNKPFKWV